jgi:hypothetical protein
VPRTIIILTSVILTFFWNAEAIRWHGPAKMLAAPAAPFRKWRRLIGIARYYIKLDAPRCPP